MQRVVCNPETGEETWVKLTPSEEAEKLARKALVEEQEREWEKESTRQALFDKSAKLQQAQTLQAEGVDVGDVSALQKEVDDLKARLKAQPMGL